MQGSAGCLVVLVLVLAARGPDAAERVWPTWEGWELMGSAGAFSYLAADTGKQLAISAAGIGAAVRKTADHALTDELRFAWQWLVDEIPSPVAEDLEATHHYLAASVIFDNGKNLSYIWSAALPPDFGFQCPLPDWTARETHVVVQTGRQALGQVLSYERNIRADYQRYIGGQLPAKVVRVWIVALATGAPQPISARILRLSIDDGGGAVTSYL